MSRFVAGILSVGLMVSGADVVSAQSFPNKPVRFVTSEPGSANDITARLISQGISGPLGQPVIIDNRGGAVTSGTIVSQAPPDGYTLLIQSSALWSGPLLQTTAYDPVRNFSPITLATRSPGVLVVHPSVAANSVKELIALARAKPGVLNYGSGLTGASNHLAAELFKTMAGVNIMRISYKGGGLIINGLLRGEVQLSFPTAAAVASHVKSGRLRALAVTSAEPSALVPGLPTVAASGLPGYESEVTSGVFAPAKTPEAIVKRLNQEIVRLLNQPDIKQKFFDSGVEIVGSSPEQLAAKIKSDIARLGKVIKDAGIRAE